MPAAPKADAHAIALRSAEPEDAEAISALLGRPGTFEGTLHLPDMPIASRLELLRRIDPSGVRLVAVAQGMVVGFAGLHVLQPSLRRSHARGLYIALGADWQGRGIGRKLMARVLEWADNWGAVTRVELHVHVDNERAIALYRSLGFVEEGRHKAYALKNGRYVDSLSMARLHPNPPSVAGV